MARKMIHSKAGGDRCVKTALQESEERFHSVFDNVSVGMAIIDLDFEIRQVNPALCRLLGYRRDELLATSFLNLTHPDDMEVGLELAQNFVRGEVETYQLERRFPTKDGQSIWGRLNVILIRDRDGVASGALAILKDRSELKQIVNSGSELHGNTVRRDTQDLVRSLATPVAEEVVQELFLEIQFLKNQLKDENACLQRELRLARDFERVIGQSEVLKNVFRQAQMAAATDSTILILGETGTGKELIAQAIHSISARRNRSLFTVNCAALPATLIESELFGYEKGAFTGAGASRVGRFELADEATIFLDEIGEMPLELQAKLLRVLQEGEFERLGSSRTIKVDVRVIAATNQQLEEAMRQGKFRADLFYRLNVFPIRMPSLRERLEDIGLLVSFFLDQFSRRAGKRIHEISRDDLDALKRYHWPGNIRELKNVIERAVIITPDERLRLLDSLRVNQEMELSLAAKGTDAVAKEERRYGRLDDVERDYILRVLEQTYWRIEGTQGAAMILGLNPGTLRSRMKKLGIQRPKLRD